MVHVSYYLPMFSIQLQLTETLLLANQTLIADIIY